MGFSLIFCYNSYWRVVPTVQLFFKQAFPFSSLEGNPYSCIRNYPTWQHYIEQNKVLNRTFGFQTDNSNKGPIKPKITSGPILPLPGLSLEPDIQSASEYSVWEHLPWARSEKKKSRMSLSSLAEASCSYCASSLQLRTAAWPGQGVSGVQVFNSCTSD